VARFIVIEDNSANLDLMVYLLRAFGHAAEGFRDGQAGLEAARARVPDAVISDMQLPTLSGHAIARAVRADPALQRLPLIAVTALAMHGDREKVLAGGFDGYIPKPIEPQTFVAEVESFLPPLLRKGGRAPRPAKHGPPGEAARAKVASPQRTLLVVDDQPANLELLKVILHHGGYAVRAAGSMREGLEEMRREKVDLVISDVHMPDGDGYAFRRAAAAEPALSHVPFLLISSSNVTPDDRDAALRSGVFDLMGRPIEPESILAAVRALLARP